MDKWNLIVDLARCENCQNCVVASHDEHVGNDYPGYAAPASAQAQAPIRVLRRVQGRAPMVLTTYLPVLCNHCDDAPCMAAGGDAVRKRSDGIVIIDPAKAQGRRDLVDACPYGAVVWNEDLQLPQTWIFDAHLLDAGWKQPRCQQVCPTEVFEAVRLDDAAMQARARRDGLSVLRPGLGTRPRVYYRGLARWERCFIGGSVSACVGEHIDCVADAQVALHRHDQLVATARTDAFGDFRFDDLPAASGAYRVDIHHPWGAARRDCELHESVYLGEIRLSPPPTQ